MNKDFMKVAIEVANEGVANGFGGPFGSVVVKDGKIVGKSSNMVFATNDPTAHAEVMAIRDASKNMGTAELSGCEIYTLGEPCPMCMAAIYWARIDKVYYANTKEQAAKVGFDDSFIYEELTKQPLDRSMVMQHVPMKEADDIFHHWDQHVDKEDLPQT